MSHEEESVRLYESMLREIPGVRESDVRRWMREEARRWADCPALAQAIWRRLAELEVERAMI